MAARPSGLLRLAKDAACKQQYALNKTPRLCISMFGAFCLLQEVY
jgi:hypothetical protein